VSFLVQQDMPRRRSGHTSAVTIGGERLSVTASSRGDGTLAEVFVRWGKHGSACAGLMDAYAVGLSVGLQRGVPLTELLQPALGLSFAPAGHTDDPEIPRVRSVVDYLAQRLAVDWLSYAQRAAMGVFTISELAGCSRPHAARRHAPGRYLTARALAGGGMCHRHTLGCGSPGA
jgi:ribonucleoside-diphosphate reductase alpha chain